MLAWIVIPLTVLFVLWGVMAMIGQALEDKR